MVHGVNQDRGDPERHEVRQAFRGAQEGYAEADPDDPEVLDRAEREQPLEVAFGECVQGAEDR